MYMSTSCVADAGPRRGASDPRTVIIDSCELLCGWWESNQGLPQEQPGFLTSEPSLHLPILTISKYRII